MLGLKNPFTNSSPAPEPVESSQPAVNELNNAVKQCQLEQDRTSKRLEELTDQLDAARADLGPATQAHGAALYEEKDSTEEARAVQEVGNRIAALEAAIAVATEKHADAQTNVHQAEQQLLSAVKGDAIDKAMELALQTQLLFSRVKQQRIEVDRQLKALVKVGAITPHSATEMIDQYTLYARLAHRPAADDQVDSGSGRKYRGWYHCVAYLCGRAEP